MGMQAQPIDALSPRFRGRGRRSGRRGRRLGRGLFSVEGAKTLKQLAAFADAIHLEVHITIEQAADMVASPQGQVEQSPVHGQKPVAHAVEDRLHIVGEGGHVVEAEHGGRYL